MQLVLFPGLGADERLFEDLSCPTLKTIVPPFPDPAPKQSLSAYARALADRLQITPEVAIGGASFGGFVAAEIATQRRISSLVLIGSALSSREIPSYYAAMEGLSRVIPDGFVARAPRNNPLVLAKYGHLSPSQKALFLDMAGKASISLLRRGVRMIFGWKGVRRDELSCPVHRIHGRLDRLIRPPSAREAKLITGGGHLISMTHPEIVSRFLELSLRA